MRLSGRTGIVAVWLFAALLQVQPGSFAAQVEPSVAGTSGAYQAVQVRPLHYIASIQRAVRTVEPVRHIRPQGPPSSFDPAPGEAAFRLRIPAIGLNKVVVEGTNQSQLAAGPGHYPGCGDAFSPPYCDPYGEVWPGDRGRMLIGAHRTMAGADFFRLGELEPRDRVRVETAWGTFDYVIDRQAIVAASDMSVVVPPGTARELVLVTCHPKYSSAQRLLYFAHLDRAVETKGGWRRA